MNRPITTTMLKIVKEGFEEEKNVKVLSIFEKDDAIYGVYLTPITEALSFLIDPLYNMSTDIEGHNIYMMELGTLLIASYKHGLIDMYNWLIHESDINIESELFNDLINNCIDNPPLNLSSFRIINHIDAMNEGNLQISIIDLIKLVENFMIIDPLDIDVSDKSNEVVMKNNLNLVRQELKQKNYGKISEAVLNEIDNSFIYLQLNLYITDDK